MRLVRGLGGALLWIVAAVLGLLGVILCVTIILLPLGIPLLRYAGSLFGQSVRLMLPRALAHPVKETNRRGRDRTAAAAEKVTKGGKEVPKTGKKMTRKMRKKASRKASKKLGRRSRWKFW